MEVHRREVILSLSAMLVTPRAMAAAPTPLMPRERLVAGIMSAMDSAPYIASNGPPTFTMYMITNAACGYCQAFHRRFPQGLPRAQMRYLVMPWPNENPNTLNYIYENRILTNYWAYMNRSVPQQWQNYRGHNYLPAMKTLIGRVGKELYGGIEGTPVFLVRFYNEEDNRMVYIDYGGYADAEKIFSILGKPVR